MSERTTARLEGFNSDEEEVINNIDNDRVITSLRVLRKCTHSN